MALVIMRKLQAFHSGDECRFRIGDDVQITLLSCKSGTAVRIAIEAPKSVIVHREEVWKRIQKERQLQPDPQPE